MVATELFSAFRDGSKLVSRREDDSFDRLSNRWSLGLLIAFALLISTSSYVGDPIDCYEPQEFTEQWVEYMDNICWISNTYYVANNESLPGPGQPLKQELQYYQWVPIILCLQAFMFCVPGMFWNFILDSAGYNVKDIVSACRGMDAINPANRDESVKYLANNMMRFMNYRRPYKDRKRQMPMGKRYGRYIFIMYMVTKVLYICNLIGQIFILNTFLNDGYHVFGWQAAVDFITGAVPSTSPMFPLVTICAFDVRGLANNMLRYNVQCVLTVNLFNEKVFIVIWWWLVTVAALSCLGLLLWLLTASSPHSQKMFGHKYLTIMRRHHNDEDLDDFVGNFLRLDGVFTLRLIAKNTNDVIAGEVVATLWDQYLANKKASVQSGDGEMDNLV